MTNRKIQNSTEYNEKKNDHKGNEQLFFTAIVVNSHFLDARNQKVHQKL